MASSLSTYPTFPATDRVTGILYVDQNGDVPGSYVYLFRWWRDILEVAHSLIASGREVRSPNKVSASITRVLEGEKSVPKWMRDLGGIKRARALVESLALPAERHDTIWVRTVHSFKGLESDRVRVHGNAMRFVSYPEEIGRPPSPPSKRQRFSDTNGYPPTKPDDEARVTYVAITRARNLLILPTVPVAPPPPSA
jgi:hypothetical protein